MAMYSRRDSIESFSRRGSQSPANSDQQKLSFNPLGEWSPPTADKIPIGAHEVSKSLRIAQVGIAVVYNLLAAGVVFGFAAIKPVLIDQDVYRDRCTAQELEDDVFVCYKQELQLNVMFTIAAVSTNVAALPIGTVLDHYGPRVASLIGVVFLTMGTLFMAFAKELPFDGYIPGYLFLALGGPFCFISSFQLSNTFPNRSGLILALLTGAFDTSSAIFLLYRLMYQGTNGNFTPKKFFLAYLIVPAFILIAQLVIMPKTSYKTVGELVKQAEDPSQDVHDSDDEIGDENCRAMIQSQRREMRQSVVSEITALLGNKGGDEHANEEEKSAKVSGVHGALHGKTAKQQILSPWFVLITLFTVIQMTRINYFVATIWNQYHKLLHFGDLATQVNRFFDVALPSGGVIAVPFIGLVLDHTSTTFVLGLLVTIATIIGILGCIPTLWAAYANVSLFVLYRPLYYTAVSDYSAKVFGFETFGKVYGLIICLAGLLNFVQTLLDAITHQVFGNDPIPVNVLLLGLALVVGVALTAFVWRKSLSRDWEYVEEAAEEAVEILTPIMSNERTYGTST